MKKIFTVALFLIGSFANAQAMETFVGMCSIASTSSTSGAQGLINAKVLNEEIFYPVSGNSKRIEVDWKSHKTTYEQTSASGQFGMPNSAVIYTSKTKEEVWLLFTETEKAVVFHTEKPDGQTNTWGGCLLVDSDKRDVLKKLVGSTVFKQLKEEDFLKLNRTTSAGQLNSCELEFQYSYQDVRSQGGQPVVLTGAFAINYITNKPPVYILKINAVALDATTSSWKVIKPDFTNISVGRKSFDPYKHTEFTCESGGRCVGYGDPKLELMEAVMAKYPFDGEVSLSLVNGGMDHTFTFSKLMPKVKSERELAKFNACTLEVIQMVSKDVK